MVTGGAIGFGRAFCRALAARGAAVAVADVDLDGARRLADELIGAGGSALAVPCDVADAEQVGDAVASINQHLGGIDVLVNNAGRHLSHYSQPFSVLSASELHELFEVNVFGVINCTLACAGSMRARGGGSIVNIASIAGHKSLTPYGVSKLAVRGLTIAFASELSGDGIRVNAISPGLMATENALADASQAFIDDYVEQRQLVHRMGTMDDIVGALLYLCSDQASFVTGQTLMVSGGYPALI
jgi:NAD(P)-dependent dehydrogenase (short-subunit alcohol dehydrogenase family)